MDIEKLKALALAAGSEQWNDDADDSAVVCDESGYAVCVCEANLGGMSTIFADQIAEFIAAANPAAVLELIAEVERLREVCPDRESVAHIVLPCGA